MKPNTRPRNKPPRWACQAIPEKRKERRRRIITAIHSGIGIGMKNIKTGTLGTITARAPARAKMPPEAPTPVVNGGPRRK